MFCIRNDKMYSNSVFNKLLTPPPPEKKNRKEIRTRSIFLSRINSVSTAFTLMCDNRETALL